MKVSRTQSRKKRVIMTVIVLLIAAVTLAWWFAPRGRQDTPTVIDQPSRNSGDNIEQPKESMQKKETTLVDRPQTPAPEKEGVKARITPIITGFNRSSDGMELLVDGGVNEIIERGGVCQFIVSWPGGGVSQQTEGINAPSSTNCRTARFSMDQLPSGVNITIQVTYDSVAYRGASTNGPSITKEQIR